MSVLAGGAAPTSSAFTRTRGFASRTPSGLSYHADSQAGAAVASRRSTPSINAGGLMLWGMGHPRSDS